jgi:hypothetical protein
MWRVIGIWRSVDTAGLVGGVCLFSGGVTGVLVRMKLQALAVVCLANGRCVGVTRYTQDL